MFSCNQEEADQDRGSREHALENGCKTVRVHTVDTDIVVILTGMFHDRSEINSG